MTETNSSIDKYIITIDKRVPPITEIAMTHFMTKVFDLANQSNCIGNGLEITKIEASVLDSDTKYVNIDECVFITNIHETEQHALLARLCMGNPEATYRIQPPRATAKHTQAALSAMGMIAIYRKQAQL